MDSLDYSMHSPQPAGTLRRQPYSRDDSSTSTLSSREESIPSFQNFIKRTPPADPSKPLPPPPLNTRRASSSSLPRCSTPSSYSRRRASSVYSRTISQWEGDSLSWTSADFADEPIPPLPTLQPLAYSASMPHLGEAQKVAGSLQPRTYNPLIVTPSPSESRAILVNSPTAQHEPPPKIMSPIGLPKTIKKRLETISLDQAKAAIRAPGTVYLLPEELRGQAVKRSRSQQPLRLGSMHMFEPDQLPSQPDPPTMIDRQGRHRSIISQPPNFIRTGDSTSPCTGYVANSPYEKSFRVGTGPERTMIPRYLQELDAPSGETTRSPGLDNSPDQRGRPRRRGSKPMQALRHLVSKRHKSESSIDEGIGARNMAQRYSRLLSEPYHQASASSGRHDTDSDGSVKAQMKLVPQPLFRSKPPAKLPGAFSQPIRLASMSPSRLRSDDAVSEYQPRRSSASSKKSLAFRLPLSRGSSHRRTSTSGSIPISPPIFVSASPQEPTATRKKSSPLRRDSQNTRASAYYPYVASRKQRRAPAKQGKSDSDPPPISYFSPIIDAGRDRKSDLQLDSSSWNRANSLRKSIQSSAGPIQPLIQRVTDGALRYIDETPSPVQPPATQSHRGWSSKARAAFDDARQTIQSPRRLLGSPTMPQVPKYMHISAPARPLDEIREGLREPEPPQRKGSLFGGMLDGWKENRAEKRREELKKVIRVLPGYNSTGN